jgi:hypothetical protein
VSSAAYYPSSIDNATSHEYYYKAAMESEDFDIHWPEASDTLSLAFREFESLPTHITSHPKAPLIRSLDLTETSIRLIYYMPKYGIDFCI